MIVLCGAGFLGSWWARFYAQRASALKIAEGVMVIDNDKVEDRNLPTQNFRHNQVGNYKAVVTSSVFNDYGVDNADWCYRLDEKSISQVIDEKPLLVIDAFDNISARFMAKMIGVACGCEVLHIAISPAGFGLVEWSKDWAIDPTRSLTPVVKEDVKAPPCELPMFQQLGVLVGMRAAIESSQYLLGRKVESWFISDVEQRRYVEKKTL